MGAVTFDGVATRQHSKSKPTPDEGDSEETELPGERNVGESGSGWTLREAGVTRCAYGALNQQELLDVKRTCLQTELHQLPPAMLGSATRTH